MPLNEKAIKNRLKKEYGNTDIIILDSVDSTNNEAKRLISGGKGGVFAVIADSQTAGRGRGSHGFYSPAGTGIYLSLVTSPDLPPEKAVRATAAAAVAVCRAIESLTDKKPQIKWVNDIFVDGRKVCGILTEAISNTKSGKNPDIVTGIGVNVSTADFPDEVKAVAGSLSDGKIDRSLLAAEIINNLLDCFANLESEEIIGYYRAHSLVTGKQITFEQNGVKYSAKAVEIGSDCSLTVELPDKTRRTLFSGEISIKL
jgi:BirA family biotin operon repressor/biotin-[acetyl-CoA-carboxylase] ligase